MTNRTEQETIINWNEAEPIISIYTASPKTKRKCLKLGFRLIKTDRLANSHEECSWWFEVPKRCVSFRREARVLSDDARAALRARMRKINRKSAEIIDDSEQELDIEGVQPETVASSAEITLGVCLPHTPSLLLIG